MIRPWTIVISVMTLLPGFVRPVDADGQVVGWGRNSVSQLSTGTSPLVGYKDVAAGLYHSVALGQDSAVSCWGYDFYAQCRVPVSLGSISQVAAGAFHTLARRSDGTVVAWGKNDLGQCLGTDVAGAPILGATVGQQVKILGVVLSGVRDVAAGEDFSVACLQDGSVVCWGRGDYGLLVPPAGMESVVEVEAGQSHILARTASGRVVGWGWNHLGQCLGSGPGGAPLSSAPDGTPVRILGQVLTGVTEIAAGYAHSLARRSDGTVVAWGSNTFGETGVPLLVGPAVAVSAGWYHSLVALADGSVRGFGKNTVGQSNSQQGGSARIHVAGGVDHSLAVSADGTLTCWGGNFYGECSRPSDLGQVKQIEAGGNHTIALLPDGRVRCWGYGLFGQSTPPAGLPTSSAVAGGGLHSMALLASGRVVCWGDNTDGKCLGTTAAGGPILGQATGQSVRHLGQELTDVIGIAGGYDHSLALRANGTVVAWGTTDNGRCIPPAGLDSVVRVVGGGAHSLALRLDSTVVGWGLNDQGQCLGTSATGAPITSVPAGAPVRRLGVVLRGVVDLAAGFDNSLAVLGNGSVVAWGNNDSGQGSVPAQLSPARRVAAGWGYSAALLEDGSVVCWGFNAAGQCLGTDAQGLPITGPAVGAPVRIRGAILAASDDLACGWDHTLAMLEADASVCGNQGGGGRATLVSNGAAWEDVGIWSWSNGGSPQVPGALTDVDLGSYGSVGSLCGAQCATLVTRGGSTLLVPLDLTLPGTAQPDHAISVSGTATMAGRVWLLAHGAASLPLDLDVPVLRAGNPVASFDIVESTVAPPAGKFLGLVRSPGLAGSTEFSLRLLDVIGQAGLSSAEAGSTAGAAVAFAPLDWDGDGVDDLVVLLDMGAGQPGALQVLLNDGSGNLVNGGCVDCRVSIASGPTCLAVGDIDGDGRQDALVGTSIDRRVVVFRNNAPSQQDPFTAGLSISTGDVPRTICVLPPPTSFQQGLGAGGIGVGTGSGGGSAGDKLTVYSPTTGVPEDVIAIPAAPTTTLNRGRRVVTGGASSTTLTQSGQPGSLVVVDSTPGATTDLLQVISVPGLPRAMDIADIDGDGFDDVVTANEDPVFQGAGSVLPVLTLFRGGPQGFGNPVPIAPPDAIRGRDVSLVDVDGDGDRDIVALYGTSDGSSSAVLLRVDESASSGSISITPVEQVGVGTPLFCAGGNLDGTGGEDVFLVGDASALVGSGSASSAAPFLGIKGSRCPADIDGDGQVNGLDLGIVLSTWGSSGDGDVNGDGTVNGADLGTLLSSWGPCAQ